MNVLLRSKVGRRFLGTFFLLSLPLLAAGWFGIRKATETLRAQTHAVLRAASDGAEAQLREFLLCLRRTAEALETDPGILACLQSTNGRPSSTSEILERVQRRVPEIVEISCLNLKGDIVAASGDDLMNTNKSQSEFFVRGRHSYWPGDLIREARTGTIRWRMSAPIKEPLSGEILGVLVVGVDHGALNALTTGRRVEQEGADTESFRIGKTGETYIVNRQGFMLTESRYVPDAVLKLKLETDPVRAAIEKQQEIMGDYRDYRGVTVSGASAILREQGWVMITEIDFSQAFAPIQRLRNLLITVAVIVGGLAGLTARQFARAIVNPLRMVDAADHALVGKDENASLVPEAHLPQDEIGDFIRKRNSRIKELIQRQRALTQEQEARAEAAAELEGLAYSMVHDMRAPLRAIISVGDLLQEGAADRLTETESGYVARMQKASLRMDKLICDMLRYSSLLRTQVALSTVSVPDLVRRLISENPAFQAHAENIQIETSIMSVKANEVVLSQCFGALLDNALRYTRPGVQPEVRIRAEKKGEWLRICVVDNGAGMPKEFQNRVFGLFQKGTNSSQGTGLGLALVRVAVKRMGGRVGVDSKDGVGSCFWMELKSAE